MQSPTKRPKKDATSEIALIQMLVLQDNPGQISPGLALKLHRAGFCNFADVKNCPFCYGICPLCHQTKPNPIRTRAPYLKGICRDCAHEVAGCATMKSFCEIRRLVFTKEDGEWRGDLHGHGELLGKFTDDSEMWKALPGFLDSDEKDTAVPRTVYLVYDGFKPVVEEEEQDGGDSQD